MKRPSQKSKPRQLTQIERRALAAKATYVGSPEHKVKNWWGGLPKARQLRGGRVGRPGKQTTTVCPLTTKKDRDRATDWVRLAIENGQYKFSEADRNYPQMVWYEADGRIWCGRCINSEAGQYKGWPIDEEERREVFD